MASVIAVFPRSGDPADGKDLIPAKSENEYGLDL